MAAPPGAENWHGMYPYSLRFGSSDRSEYEAERFWFHDAIHYPNAVAPFDATILHFAQMALSQYNTRHFLVPAALGIDFRIHNGYVYMSPIAVEDAAVVENRSRAFARRAGAYYREWEEKYASWQERVARVIADIAETDFTPLPHEEPEGLVLEGDGSGSSYRIISAYHRLLDLLLLLWQYHFEMLNISYAAYLDFFDHCKQLFPGLDDTVIVQMISGIEVDLYRPDEELRRLAQLALDKDVAGLIDPDDPPGTVRRLRSSAQGQAWYEEWRAAHDPWFEIHSGTGFAHTDPCWADHSEIPLGFIKTYAGCAVDGRVPRRDIAARAAARDSVIARHGAMLAGSEQETFLAGQRLAAKVFHYVENHNFHIEHRGHSAFFRKVRELARLFVDAGFIRSIDDIFMLTRHEVEDALFDLCTAWACGAPAAGSGHWPAVVAERRAVLRALADGRPAPAFGPAPAVVTEPFTVMLYGIDETKIGDWLSNLDPASGHGDPDVSGEAMHGLGVSAGIAEGPVRIVRSEGDLSAVEPGDVVVAATMVPAWSPVLARAAAVLTDVGGVMSHGAILCREFGVPSVAALGVATAQLRTGQMLRVDGGTGQVTVLSGNGRSRGERNHSRA